jgi:hypothetical protein
MKKTVLIIAIPIVIILFSICGLFITQKTTIRNIKKYNSQYEYYINKSIYGTELVTLINKVINENEINKVEKDEKGFFIENNENSIKINIKMNTNGKTYQMETFYNNDITKFVENFNLVKFRCNKIEYHKKSGRVSKLYFEEILE